VIVAGGMESMSQAPYIVRNARGGYVWATASSKTYDDRRLFCALDHVQWDSMATMSLRKTKSPARNRTHGHCVRTARCCRPGCVLSLCRNRSREVKSKKKTIVVDKDDAIRRDTTMEALAKLKPFSRKAERLPPACPG